MKLKKKTRYRLISGLLAMVTLVTSVLPAYANDALPKEYTGTNPFEVVQEKPLSEEEMQALLERLRADYVIEKVPEIESEPSDEYKADCEKTELEEEFLTLSKTLFKGSRTLAALSAPVQLQESSDVNTNIFLEPTVEKAGRVYTFSALSLKENPADTEELKKIAVTLDGEDYSAEVTDFDAFGGNSWEINNISFPFSEEKIYRFVIEYTYEKKVYDEPDVSQDDAHTAEPTGTAGVSRNSDVSDDDLSSNEELPRAETISTFNGDGTDVSSSDLSIHANTTATETTDVSAGDVSAGDISGGDVNVPYHYETVTKKVYSPTFLLHRVQVGESLKSVSQDKGVTAADLRKDNKIFEFSVKRGSLLFVRSPKADFERPFEWNDTAVTNIQKLGIIKGTEYAYNSVNLATLSLLYEEEDISVKELDTVKLVRYFYTGLDEYKGLFGYSVSSLFDERLIDLSDDKKLVVLKDMSGVILTKQENSFVSEDGMYSLTETDECYRLTDIALNYMLFNKDGLVTEAGNKKGELYRIAYDEDGSISKLITRSGKEFIITLNAAGLISKIQNPDGTYKLYEYTEGKTLNKVTNERGYNSLYTYDAQKRLLTAKNQMGKVSLCVSYDENGLINSYTDAQGNVSVFNISGSETSFTDAKGIVTVYHRDDSNRHTRITYADGKEESKTYDLRGNILSTTDKAGETLSFTYNGTDNILTESNSKGVYATYTYDTRRNLLSETDANGNVTRYEYDERNNPILIIYPNGTKTSMVFDERGRMLENTIGESTTKYEYAGNSYNIAKSTDPNGNTTLNSYDKMDRLISHTEGDKVTTYEYSETGKLLKEIGPDGKTETYEYDAADNSIGVTDPSGNKVGMRYDDMGRIVQVINGDGSHTDFTYDENGNLLKEESSTGLTKTYTYDINDEVVSEESSSGENITYERDALGRVVKEKYKDGTEVTYEYHKELNVLTRKKDELGREITYEYDKVGNLLKEAYSNGQSVSYTYDSLNRRTSTLDERGVLTEYSYDKNGNIVKETSKKGSDVLEKTYEYDSNNNLIKETDYDGIVVSYTYDSSNRLTKVTDACGYSTIYSYGNNGETLSETDRNGNTRKYEYDNSGNLTKLTDAEGNITTYAYDSEGRVLTTSVPGGFITGSVYNENGLLAKKVDPFGNIEEYTYDDAGNVLSVKYADGSVTKYTYDAKGNKTSETTPDGSVTRYTYNKLGWPTKTTYDNGTYVIYTYNFNGKITEADYSNGLKETYEYDAVGNLRTYTEKAGISTTYDYDAFGRVLCVVSSSGKHERYTYTKGGKVLSKTDEFGRVISYEYDKRGKLLKTRDTLGLCVSYEYDGNGNTVKVTEYDYEAVSNTDVSGNVDVSGNIDISGNGDVSSGQPVDNTRISTFEYDKNGNVITTVYPNGCKEKNTYDFGGRILSSIDRNGNVTKNEYDALGRLVKTISPMNEVTSYGYDVRGNQSYTKDALGNVTSYTYDSMGRMITSTLPNGATTTYKYNKQGKVIEEQNALSEAIKYEYDLDGNLIKKTYPNGIFETYEYDGLMRVKCETDIHGLKTSYTYDEAGNVLTVTNEIASHKYNQSNNVFAEETVDVSDNEAISGNNYAPAVDGNIVTTYTYDRHNRIIKEETEGLPSTVYEYDKYGNISRINSGKAETVSVYDCRGNLLSQKTETGLETTYFYDISDRVVEKRVGNRKVQYSYDAIGNVLCIVAPNGAENHLTYDADGRRLTETDAAGNKTFYEYDKIGNVVSVTDALGFKSIYEYDSVGNLAKETHIDGTITEYGYDAIGRLIKTKDADGTSAFYTYDKMGNLVEETLCDEADYYAPVNGEHSRREAAYEYYKTGELKSQGGDVLNREHYTYYTDGTLKEIKYPSGKTVGYEYDTYSRNIATLYNKKVAKTQRYNEYGEVVSSTDESGVSEFSFDNSGRLIKSKTAAGTVEYSYDLYGNKEGITYPDGQKVTYEYDVMDRVIKVCDKDGIKTEFTYDAVGNVIKEERSDGIVTETSFDALYRKISVNTRKDNKTISAFEYTYDDSGRVSSEKSTDETGNLFKSYEYDSAGKLVRYAETRNEEYYSDGFGILRLDAVNPEANISGNDGSISYNSPESMSAVSISSNNGAESKTLEGVLKNHNDIRVITYSYDTFGNRTGEITFDKGIKSESTYIYDTENRLEEKKIDNKTAEKYSYDKDGNLTSITKPGQVKIFTYTVDNKLSETRVNGSLMEQVKYDATGLKVSSTLKKEYNVTVTDTITTKEETKGKTRLYSKPYEETTEYTEKEIHVIPGKDGYEYTEYVGESRDTFMQRLADFVGILAPFSDKEWHECADSFTEKEYRTVKVEGVDSSENSREVVHENTLTGEETYVKRTPNKTTETTEESSHTETRVYYETAYFAYDLTLSNPQVLAEESAPGVSRASYIYAGEERLSSSSLGTYIYDGRGSVKKVINGNTVVRDYEYDPYGNITNGAPSQDRMYGYNGEEYTPQSGLIYLRARHYNPSTATFTSKDTYAGEKRNPVTRNRYAYANNNPVMYEDPSGHSAMYTRIVAVADIVAPKPKKTSTKASAGIVTGAAIVAATAKKAAQTAAAKKTANPATAAVQAATTVVVNAPKNAVTAAVSAAYSATIYGTNPNGSLSIAYNSTKYYSQDRARKIEALKKTDIFRAVNAAINSTNNAIKKFANSIKETSPATTETSQNEWWKNNSQTYLGNAQMMGGVIGVDVYSCINGVTHTIAEKISEFRQKHPIMYSLALTAVIGLIATFAGGAIAAIAAAALEAAAISVTSSLVLTAIKAYMYGLLGDTNKSMELLSNLPATVRDAFEIGAVVGAIAEVVSMVISKIWNKICELFGKAKDWIKDTSTVAETTAETSSAESGQIIQCNTKDPVADELAKRIGGQPRSAFADDPIHREFDAISDQYVAQAKPPLKCVNKAVRSQMKATFEAAKNHGRTVYYQFEGMPSQEVIDKLYEYSERYGVEVIIDTKPLGISN